MTLWQILFLLVDLVLIQLVIGIIMERRNPTATWGWLLVLVLAPVVGIPLYLIFGRGKVRRHLARHGSACEEWRAALQQWEAFAPDGDLPRGLSGGHLQIARLIVGLGATPPRSGNDVELLKDGPATFEALIAAVEEASAFVHLEYYIYADGGVGRQLRRALADAAARGVEVRLLCDAVGSAALPGDYFAELESRGARVAWFAPLRFTRLRRRPDFRNHRKILVADGKVGFVGGINIDDSYLETGTRGRPWRDTHLRIAGPAVRDLEAQLMESWAIATGEMLATPEHLAAAEREGDAIVQILGSGPDDSWPRLEKAFAAALQLARARVDIVTPYFVPSEVVESALSSAALRGVEVRVMVPMESDVRLAGWAACSYYPDLLAAGVRIFEYGPRMQHGKTLSVDGLACMIGSANLDMRSFRLNYEVGTIAFDEALTAALERSFEEDLLSCRELTLENLAGWSRLQRFRNNLARLLSPLL